MDVLLSDTRGQRQLKSLILMCVFVGNVAADCPKPEGGENMIPTTDTLLKNDFPDGSDATLECGNGYVKESGSGILTCLSEKWTEPDLVCKKRNCGVPKSQPNMQFHIPNGTLFGDVIQVFCDEGYQISGASYKNCFASGWFGSAQCYVVRCSKPSQVPNGRSSWTSEESPTYKQVINYICNEGYTLSGNDSIMCSKTGEYDSQPPECKGVAIEDKITTKLVTSAPTSTQPVVMLYITETLSSAASSTTPAAHRDAAITASTPAAASTSEQDGNTEITSTNKNNGEPLCSRLKKAKVLVVHFQ
ncbi:complement decay-accelerating factor [Nematolebias whitei]|uniref:complement decay-accelerating factor n=1 Tax=Nematolebias whitei TaxID=451745 RepID=UPI00189AD4E8|nr:complement decay-accelerating factor [Nematolebias whitei]